MLRRSGHESVIYRTHLIGMAARQPNARNGSYTPGSIKGRAALQSHILKDKQSSQNLVFAPSGGL